MFWEQDKEHGSSPFTLHTGCSQPSNSKSWFLLSRATQHLHMFINNAFIQGIMQVYWTCVLYSSVQANHWSLQNHNRNPCWPKPCDEEARLVQWRTFTSSDCQQHTFGWHLTFYLKGALIIRKKTNCYSRTEAVWALCMNPVSSTSERIPFNTPMVLFVALSSCEAAGKGCMNAVKRRPTGLDYWQFMAERTIPGYKRWHIRAQLFLMILLTQGDVFRST